MPAPLISLSTPLPGVNGLNTQDKTGLLGGQWCTQALNCVIDENGRMASRKGWAKLNSGVLAADENVIQLFEFNNGAGVTTLIAATDDNKIYKDADTATPVDITGTATLTSGNFKFQNFNGELFGWNNQGETFYWSGTGSGANITFAGATTPAGTTCLAAWGRMWTLDSTGTVLYASYLLNATDYDTAGRIVQDLHSVWTHGVDKAIGLAAFNNQLIIFCEQSIIVYDIPGGVPSDYSLNEVVYGIGCEERDSIVNVGVDLFFLSRDGVRSLGRTLIQDKMPMADISKNVRDDFVSLVAAETAGQVRACYSDAEGFYLLSLPDGATTYVYDLRGFTATQQARVFTWTGNTAKALHVAKDRVLYMGYTGAVGKYDTYYDNGEAYQLSFRGGYFEPFEQAAPNASIILKKIKMLITTQTSVTISVNWAFDFKDNDRAFQKTITAGSTSEWGVFEWGLGEWSGGTVTQELNGNTGGTGKVIRFGADLTINGTKIAFHMVDMYFKRGAIR